MLSPSAGQTPFGYLLEKSTSGLTWEKSFRRPYLQGKVQRNAKLSITPWNLKHTRQLDKQYWDQALLAEKHKKTS